MLIVNPWGGAPDLAHADLRFLACDSLLLIFMLVDKGKSGYK